MGLSDDIDRLKKIPFLSVLSDEALRLIAFNSEESHARDGDTVFFVGDPATCSFFVLEGALSLQELVNGEMRERSLIMPDSLADPYALISDIKRSYTGKAVGSLSFLMLERATFLKVLKTYPELALKIQDYLADDIEQTVGLLNKVAKRLDYLG